jgi:hypothetical protein
VFNANMIPPPAFLVKLQDMDWDKLISCLYLTEYLKPSSNNEDNNATNCNTLPSLAHTPLKCMNQDKIVTELHHPGTTPPPIRPSDCPHGSDTKLSWTPEELHCITGCRCFRNCCHIIDASKDSHLQDTGEFFLLLGFYRMIPKAPRRKSFDCTLSYYLDIVHIDIAFGDCALIGGYKYALVFVNHATRYNWTFGLKYLQHEDIIAAFLLF